MFVMKDRYALGEAIEFRVRNNSGANYSYRIENCPSAKLYRPDGSSFLAGHEGRDYGFFQSCDFVMGTTLEPGNEVVLMTWDQCVGDKLVLPGTYTVSDLPFTNGLDTEAETTFVISGGDSEDPSLLCPSHLRK